MGEIRIKLRDALEKYQDQFPPDERPNHLKIAVEVGISPNTLSRYLNNKVERTELSVIAKLCEYLNIRDMNDLFEYVEEDDTT